MAPEGEVVDFVILLGDQNGKERATRSLRCSFDPRGSLWRVSYQVGASDPYIEIQSRDTLTSSSSVLFTELQIAEG
jgi:hypothetical protein